MYNRPPLIASGSIVTDAVAGTTDALDVLAALSATQAYRISYVQMNAFRNANGLFAVSLSFGAGNARWRCTLAATAALMFPQADFVWPEPGDLGPVNTTVRISNSCSTAAQTFQYVIGYYITEQN